MTDLKSYMIHYTEKHRDSIMKLLFIILFLLILKPIFSEPVWSGNVSVSEADFVNFIEDTPLAGASSSFTRNTVVEVTNPQNGRTIEITIVKRAPRPGVFLLVSTAAGEALGLPFDQILPVQVRVVTDTTPSAYENRFESNDPDINPAVTLPEEDFIALAAPDADFMVEEVPVGEETPEEILDIDDGDDVLEGEIPAEADSFLDGPVPVPGPLEPENRLTLANESTDSAVSEDDVPVVEAAVDEADIPEVILPDETISETALIPMETAEDNIIYFLTPSDFRPPKAPVVAEVGGEEEIIPVYMDRELLEDKIAAELKNGSSYIQLGAYSTAAMVYEEMESIAARYPMIVWTDKSSRGTIYKLLIGPLTSDETGVLSYRFKSAGYGDLFLYKP